ADSTPLHRTGSSGSKRRLNGKILQKILGVSVVGIALLILTNGEFFWPGRQTGLFGAEHAMGLRGRIQGQVHQASGLNFSPFVAGDPTRGSQVSRDQVLTLMQKIAPYTPIIRTFSMSGGLENAPAVARQLGLKAAATAWISSDPNASALEI